MSKKKFNIRGLLPSLALFLFLVGLPLGSWYYLKQGYKYRKAALEELKDYGALPAFTTTTLGGQQVEIADLDSGLLVVYLADPAEPLADTAGNRLTPIVDQFSERKDIHFLFQFTVPEGTATAVLESYLERYQLTVSERVLPAYSAPGAQQKLAEALGFPYPEGQDHANNTFVLLARGGEIRRYYDLREAPETERLVTHLAMLMPTDDVRGDIVFRREKEK